MIVKTPWEIEFVGTAERVFGSRIRYELYADFDKKVPYCRGAFNECRTRQVRHFNSPEEDGEEIKPW